MTAGYRTYILEFRRNNGMLQENIAAESKFVMLDYFDILYYKELTGPEKTYMNYFSFKDAFNGGRQSKASYKTLSLYQHKEKITKNPFITAEDGGRFLSERPFLGVIQLCLCKEAYSNRLLDEGDVDGYLTQMEQEILQASAGVLVGETEMQIYRSSATGDFCLVMRTDTIEDIYRVASRLNNSRNNSGDSFKVLTYTNVGIESRTIDNDGGCGEKYCTFSPSFLDKHGECIIAIRFSADSKVFGEMKGKMEKSLLKKGLFGRYDYLLHVKIKDFAEIYPELCRRKFGELKGTQAQPVGLGELIRNPQVRNINERILVDCEESAIDGTKVPDDLISEEESQKNKALYNQIKELDSYLCDFSEETQAFRDLHRGTEELYKAFSSGAMEKDEVLNWHIWYKDMEVLCACIREEMSAYAVLQDEEKKKELRIHILSSWRLSLQAISKYTRLVQNVNYQTYQSPLYEMQTQVDMEKVMTAYRETMRMYVQAHIEATMTEKGQASWIEPIIYPELTEDQVRIAAPFTGILGRDSCTKRSILCKVPSIEYFGRYYDLLPWILHEASHQLRVLSRKERNEFVIGYIFKHVFKKVVGDIMYYNSYPNRYVAEGRFVDHLLNSFCLVAKQEMDDEINQYRKSQGKDPSYEQMVHMMSVYLDSTFACDDKVKRSFDAVREDFFDILSKRMGIQETSGQKGAKSRDELEIKLEKIKEGEKNVELAESLVEQLLGDYKDKVISLLMKEGVAESNVHWINEEDMLLPPRRYEKRVLEICKILKENTFKCKAVLKEYFFSIKALYDIFREYSSAQEEKARSERRIRDFLGKVYKEYSKQKQTREDEFKDFLEDPETKRVLRNAGMMGDEDVFCSRNVGIFNKISSSTIQEIKSFRTSIYREAFADLLMATSLGLSAFGYCRQVLQIVSDAKIEHNTYIYDDIDYNRFRVIAAVLMAPDGKEEPVGEDEYWIDGTELIEQGKRYCLGTLRCIRDMMLEQEGIRDNSKESTLVQNFVGDVYEQLTFCLGNMQENPYKCTLLYVFLHGEQADMDKKIRIKWNKYKKITNKCNGFRHLFWRLECFCRGLDNILTNKKLFVEKDLFTHMSRIHKEILDTGENGKGCKWESGLWECMWDTKRDVGDFYNNPEEVYEKKSADKLENTIKFIQNFYYHNRLSVVKEGG